MGEFPNKATQFSKDNQPPNRGNKKGNRHISTHIQEMLNDPDFELKLKNGEVLKGRPMEAIIKTAVAKAVSGDMRAFDMLAKYGYGSNLNIAISKSPAREVLEAMDLVEKESGDDGQVVDNS